MKKSLVLLASFAAAPALACAFHDYIPDPTLVDRMIASEHILLAQVTPGDATRLSVVEVLEGPDVALPIPPPADPALLDALADTPDAVILYARDGAYGPWQALRVLDAPYREVVTELMPHLPDWEFGADMDRYQTFADLLDHPALDIRDLALRELDRAPYWVLRQVRLPSVATLTDPGTAADPDLAPIRTLLLGIKGGADAAPALDRSLEMALAGGGGIVGAHATALIEVSGQAGVQWVVQHLRDPAQGADAVESLVEALALQAVDGAGDVHEPILSAVAAALPERPSLAPAVARQFGTRSEFALAGALAEVLRMDRPAGIADLMAVSQYVALATGDLPRMGRTGPAIDGGLN